MTKRYKNCVVFRDDVSLCSVGERRSTFRWYSFDLESSTLYPVMPGGV